MEHLNLNSKTVATVSSVNSAAEDLAPKGRYTARLFDKDGNLKWEVDFDNLVTDVGARAMMDTFLAGSGYTAAFYLGLISSASYTGISPSDTASSHAGWTEAGNVNAPAYGASTRPAVPWSIASGSGAGNRIKSMSAPLSFTFTSAGTVKGSFMTTSGVKDGTTGTLFSAGLFTGGDRAVGVNDVLQVSYQLAM